VKLRNKRAQSGVSLNDIFDEDDDLGLLNVKPLKRNASAQDKLHQEFEKINAFVAENDRLPKSDSDSFQEKLLARTLAKLFSNDAHRQALADTDVHGIFSRGIDVTATSAVSVSSSESEPVSKSELVKSLADIFDDDDDDLLSFEDDSIFTIKHISQEKKEQPDEIAKRQPCANFERYKSIFTSVHQQLKTGSIEKIRFKHELKIAAGDIFILYGVMCYVNSVGDALDSYSSYNARLHLIFENGTESNMLYQSLGAGLIRDKEGSKVLVDGLQLSPEPEQVSSGMIYIVSTLSKNSALSGYRDLYKIGYTDTTVEQRVANAEKDKTFLEAPIRIVSTAQCFNFDPHKLEVLIHGFLHKQRLNIKLTAKDGSLYHPREWFAVPLATAQAVIQYIIDGTISLYRMDNTTGRIVKK
jgi:hypothetical protein